MLSGPEAGRYALWWARSRRGPRAAAMTVRVPGRTAMILYGPGGLGRRDVLVRLLRQATDAALANDLAFVQGMLPPGGDADALAFVEAGYVFLAELAYLRRELAAPVEELPAALEWEPFRPGQEAKLADVVEQTYAGSQDCPGLRGLRRMEDVLDGHKASGNFRPASWWTASHAGEPVGCVLVNDAADRTDVAELVYLGVRPGWRKRGWGRAMVRHALADAQRRGLRQMNVAVDAANTPAGRLYHGEAFREVDRREVYIKPAARADCRPR